MNNQKVRALTRLSSVRGKTAIRQLDEALDYVEASINEGDNSSSLMIAKDHFLAAKKSINEALTQLTNPKVK